LYLNIEYKIENEKSVQWFFVFTADRHGRLVVELKTSATMWPSISIAQHRRLVQTFIWP